ncbi:hypothetical protein [Pseudomonas thivervalensis]|uniref:hypothetical protein n=1 Tax=Pseudomonas thivervalensis TaxID=86265 RepID=UPI00069D44D6|nr:hypothetical protein [Pseudomonas thivervalensis]OAB54413.1 hypothetical protein APS14_15775 [Pseudomonas thivervalensis]SDF34666.1 hypothetical protein SAMN04490204_0410 [Pseudomonas thivervalensis]
MTSKSINVDGEVLTLQQIARRSRSALRIPTSDSGVLLDPPEIVGQIIDDLIPKSVLDTGEMTVRFQTSDIATPHDLDEWELRERKAPDTGNGRLVDDGQFGPVLGRPTEINIPVPTVSLVDDDVSKASTTYEYRFIHFKGADGNPDRSDWFPAEIDRYAPEHDKRSNMKLKPEAAVFVNLAPSEEIDDEWLANNSTLDLNINIAYDFYREDDLVHVYAGTNYGGGTPVHTQALTSSGEVSVPTTAIPQLDGQYYVWYVLEDVVGNISEDAFPSAYYVRRRPRPQLIDSYIPKGILPDVVDLEDLTSPVYVEVPYTTNGQDTDRIIPKIVNFNGSTDFYLGSQELGPDTPNKKLQFHVTTSKLVGLWGSSTAETAVFTEYQFSRTTETPVPSNPVESALDFSYRGPVNPIFPGLENPNMVRVTVVAVGGSGTPNHITADDRGKPATISTPMVDASSQWLPIGDEIARLWFNGVEVHSANLTAGSLAPLTFQMTAADIDAAGVGKKLAHWTIEEAGGRNVMRSYPTEVQVDAVRVVFLEPTVRLFNGFVSCRYLVDNYELPVTVPIDPVYMPTGTVVTLKSVGTTDEFGLDEIPGTDYSGEYVIKGTETGGQFEKNIEPYLTKLKPIQPPHSSGLPNGYIKIWYEVDVGGVLTPSLEFINEVSLLNNSFQYCDGTDNQ